MTNELMIEERVPLAALAAELGVDRKTVVRWADLGYGGWRLECYRIGRKRFSSRPAAARFLAAINAEDGEAAIGAAEQAPRDPGMLCSNEHTR